VAFVAVFGDAAGLAKVDAAIELTHDDELDVFGEFGAQWARSIEAAIELCGAEVCEHAHFFTNLQQATLWTKLRCDVVPFGSTACAHQYGIGCDGLLDDFVGDGHIVCIQGRASKEGVFEIPLDSGTFADS